MAICPVNRSVLQQAFRLDLTNFEDAVQIACAIDQELEAILTRDQEDFLKSSISVLSIIDLLQRLND